MRNIPTALLSARARTPRFRQRARLACFVLGAALLATGCAGAAPTPSDNQTGIDTPAERLAGESSVLSETNHSTGRFDTRGTISELRFTRGDGTEAICFQLHIPDTHGPAGGLDCPEWAQPTTEQKTKERTKP